jgi:PIN domain nuclease of toxin-antitoxin system
MKLLLDSHAFVWTHEEPQKLLPNAAMEIKNPANDLFLSAASVWELQIKIQIGKFNFKDTLEDIIAEQQLINGLQILPVNLAHALYLKNLPLHHKDPFDRILIAQAIIENMVLISADPKFSLYQANLLW